MANPQNKNFLHNVKWEFTVKRLPGVSFFIQSINLPSMSITKRDIPTPFVKIPMTGDHIDYGEVNITFKVAEDMSNYIQLHNWMTGIGFPDNFGQHEQLVQNGFPSGYSENTYSDATLLIKTNAKNPNVIITFERMFPVFISDLEFTTMGMMDEMDCTATFSYLKYRVTTTSNS